MPISQPSTKKAGALRPNLWSLEDHFEFVHDPEFCRLDKFNLGFPEKLDNEYLAKIIEYSIRIKLGTQNIFYCYLYGGLQEIVKYFNVYGKKNRKAAALLGSTSEYYFEAFLAHNCSERLLSHIRGNGHLTREKILAFFYKGSLKRNSLGIPAIHITWMYLELKDFSLPFLYREMLASYFLEIFEDIKVPYYFMSLGYSAEIYEEAVSRYTHQQRISRPISITKADDVRQTITSLRVHVSLARLTIRTGENPDNRPMLRGLRRVEQAFEECHTCNTLSHIAKDYKEPKPNSEPDPEPISNSSPKPISKPGSKTNPRPNHKTNPKRNPKPSSKTHAKPQAKPKHKASLYDYMFK